LADIHGHAFGTCRDHEQEPPSKPEVEVLDPKLPPVPRLDVSVELDEMSRSRLDAVLSKVRPPSLDLEVLEHQRVTHRADVEVWLAGVFIFFFHIFSLYVEVSRLLFFCGACVCV
jgi:hypothetical protein